MGLCEKWGTWVNKNNSFMEFFGKYTISAPVGIPCTIKRVITGNK